MIKKLAVSSLAVAALGLSSVSVASEAGSKYVTLQSGISKTQISDVTVLDTKIRGKDENGFAMRIRNKDTGAMFNKVGLVREV